jgi:hypothetical protein
MMGTLTGAPIASKLITFLDAQYVECKVICTFEPLETISVCELLDSEIFTSGAACAIGGKEMNKVVASITAIWELP